MQNDNLPPPNGFRLLASMSGKKVYAQDDPAPVMPF